MQIENFLEEFKLPDEDIFGIKKLLDVCTVARKPKKTKEEIMSDYDNDLIRAEISEQLTNEAMFYELFTELFMDDNRPIRKIYFKGDIRPDSFDKELWHDYYETLIKWLELENGIEDILSIHYDKITDLTVITFYGS